MEYKRKNSKNDALFFVCLHYKQSSITVYVLISELRCIIKL